MQTCLCNVDPLKPHFYIVKLGFTWVLGIHFFLISALKHRSWVLERVPTIYVLSKNKKNIPIFLLKIIIFTCTSVKYYSIMFGCIFVMKTCIYQIIFTRKKCLFLEQLT